jgi:hypothetical protein
MQREIGPQEQSMRTTIVITGFGCVLLTAAIHLQAVAQNQPRVTAPNKPTPSPSIAAPSGPKLSTHDRKEFNYILGQAKSGKLPQANFGELVQAIATEFRGYAYEADSLDQTEPETLKISLKKFDCVLFIEAVLGLAQTISTQTDRPEAQFIQTMQSQRYRNGAINGYCSRLHYFSDWILTNQKQGLVRDLGDELGGIPFNQPLNFISQNWQKYPRLKANPANRQCINAMEQQLGTVTLRYVPTDRIHQIYSQLQSGDIVAVATRIPGLDVTHTGLVHRQNDQVGLIHAAPNVGVIVSADLQTYIERLGPDVIGIMVARPIAPQIGNK